MGMIRGYPVHDVMHDLVARIEAEMDCRERPACRYDVIVSSAPTQRGYDLIGGDSRGRVWVRQVGEDNTSSLPCPPWTTAQIEVGVIRCHQSVGDEVTELPPTQTYDDETAGVYADMLAVRAAAARVTPSLTFVSWRPYGPSQAIGSLTQFSLRV